MNASTSVSKSEKLSTCPLRGSGNCRDECPCPRQSMTATVKPRLRRSRTVSKYFSMNSLRPVKTHTVPLPPAGASQRAKRNSTPSGVVILPVTTSSGTGLPGIETSFMAQAPQGRAGSSCCDVPLFNGRARQHGLAGFHPVDVIERIPGRADIRCGRVPLVMSHEIADQRLGDAELHVAVDMRVGGIIDLGNQNLESRLEDQRVEMRRPIGMPALCLQQTANDAVGWNGITDHHHGAKPEASVGIRREFAAQVHLGLFWILVLVKPDRQA